MANKALAFFFCYSIDFLLADVHWLSVAVFSCFLPVTSALAEAHWLLVSVFLSFAMFFPPILIICRALLV